MLSHCPRSPNNQIVRVHNVECVIPGHLPVKQQDYKKKYRNLASTYVTFSADGNELLVNLGGEQIYLFDINSKRKTTKFDIHAEQTNKEHSVSSNGFRNIADGFSGPSSCSNGVSLFSASFPVTVADKKQPPLLPTRVEMLRLKANQAFDFQHFSTAIMLYNKAISLNGNTALLYGNRAAAYMKRAWDGDIYAAMRDCHTALHLDPAYVKAHFRLARCLLELQWVQEAEECLRSFKEKFPGHVHSHACKALCKDIQDAVTPSCDDGELPQDTRYVYTRAVCELPQDTRAVCELPQDTWAVCELPQDTRATCELPRDTRAICELPRDTRAIYDGELPRDSSECGSSDLQFKVQDSISQQERSWREAASDYKVRFCGHCNTTTDIKEANFFGSEGQYIVAGSDDGSFFIWDRKTTNIVRVLKGDDAIVNCLQPHPSSCLLATSGIDQVVRLWSPRPMLKPGQVQTRDRSGPKPTSLEQGLASWLRMRGLVMDGSKNDREVLDLDDAASANQKRMNADPFEVMLMNMGYRITSVHSEEGSETSGSEDAAINCRAS
ncbi:unnamed protein product [Timema podura]|uniref:WD and tetratricopeptide repeats protein 1 n=1 Tax=Timema podura TaxID=61482 RepID=A0ABN7NUW9_TIMPD|nr:unnamed protein product [Timema podura]